MTQSAVVKWDIQKRHDDLRETIRKNLDVLRDSSRVWHQAEGDRMALTYFRRRKIETALELGSFPPRSALVDVGCGTGDNSLLLARVRLPAAQVDLSSTCFTRRTSIL